MKYVRCVHLYIPWKFGERGSTPRGATGRSLSFFVFFVRFFVCPSRYDARHRKPRRCVYALHLGGTGISPPDSFSYRSNFRFRSSFRSLSSSSSTTSGDIFYCSGNRQLNHSSSFTVTIYRKFAMHQSLNILSHLKRVTILPCEMFMPENKLVSVKSVS